VNLQKLLNVVVVICIIMPLFPLNIPMTQPVAAATSSISFDYTIRAKGTTAERSYSYTVFASGTQTATESGSVTGTNDGVPDGPGGYFFYDGVTYYAQWMEYITAHIDYGTTFSTVPTPTVTASHAYYDEDNIAILNPTATGCDVRLPAYRRVGKPGQVNSMEWWPATPEALTLNWTANSSAPWEDSVSGSGTVPAYASKDLGSLPVAPNNDTRYEFSFTVEGIEKSGGSYDEQQQWYVLEHNHMRIYALKEGAGWKLGVDADQTNTWESVESGTFTVTDDDTDQYVTTTNLVAPNNDTSYSLSIEVDGITYEDTYGIGVVKGGGVIAWLGGEDGRELHATTAMAASTLTHQFEYVVKASGNSNPPRNFSYEMNAVGQEWRVEKWSSNRDDFIDEESCPWCGCETKTGDYDACASGGWQLEGWADCDCDVDVNEIWGKASCSCSPERENDYCWDVNVELKVCQADASVDVDFDYKVKKKFPWSGTPIAGSSFVRSREGFVTITTYPYNFPGHIVDRAYNLTLDANCIARNSVDCGSDGNRVWLVAEGKDLKAKTDYEVPWSYTFPNTSETVHSSDGDKVITTTVPLTASEYSLEGTAFEVEVKVGDTVYKDLNGDGIVECGGFQVWIPDTEISDEPERPQVARVHVSAMRPPSSYLESLKPTVAQIGDPVSGSGYSFDVGGQVVQQQFESSIDGPITGGLTPYTKTLETDVDVPGLSFEVNTLSPGVQIIYYSAQDNDDLWAPGGRGAMRVNFPPRSHVNWIEGIGLDLNQNLVAVYGNSVTFSGVGLDRDGEVVAYEWSSNKDGGLSDNARFSTSNLSLGTHVISFRVKDNDGKWSPPVQKQIKIIRTPVLLLHGYLSEPAHIRGIGNRLKDEGFDVSYMDMRHPIDYSYRFEDIPLIDTPVSTNTFKFSVPETKLSDLHIPLSIPLDGIPDFIKKEILNFNVDDQHQSLPFHNEVKTDNFEGTADGKVDLWVKNITFNPDKGVKGDLVWAFDSTFKGDIVPLAGKQEFDIGEFVIVIEFTVNRDKDGRPKSVSGKIDLGVPLFHVNLANGSIQGYAGDLGVRIQEIKARTGAPSVDIIAKDMGGLVARWYVNAGHNDVRKLVMLGVPNHGFAWAEYGPALIGSAIDAISSFLGLPILAPVAKGAVDTVLGKALKDMQPHSSFIRKLNDCENDAGYDEDSCSDKLNYYVDYLNIAGDKGLVTLSHQHIIILDKEIAVIPWLRDGDLVVPVDSADLDGVPMKTVNHWFWEMDEAHSDIYNPLRDALGAPYVSQAQRAARMAAGDTGDRRVQLSGARSPLQATQEITTDPGVALQWLPSQRGNVITGEQKNHELMIDASVRQAHLNLRWHEGALAWSLQTPSGIALTPSTLDSYEGTITYTEDISGHISSYTLADPAPGLWNIEIQGTNTSPSGTDYLLTTYLETDISVGMDTNKDRYLPGDLISITARVQEGDAAVTDATVVAEIAGCEYAACPEIPLLDDGNYGDGAANDGIYGGVLTGITTVDSHDIQVVAYVTRDGQRLERRVVKTIWVQPLPDLSLTNSDLELSTAAPQYGEPVQITATIHNQGEIDVSYAEILFYDGELTNERLIGTAAVEVPITDTGKAVIEWTPDGVGEHVLHVQVSPFNEFLELDYDNNQAVITTTLGDQVTPVASAGITQTVLMSVPVRLDGSASYDNSGIVTYTWRVGTEYAGLTRRLSGASPVITTGFVLTGTYPITLTVMDASGNTDVDTSAIHVISIPDDIQPPVAEAGPDITVEVDEDIQFDGSASQIFFGSALFMWDVNSGIDGDEDGIPTNDADLTGLKPLLKGGYDKPGEYTAQLLLADEAGLGPVTDSLTVKVVDTQSPHLTLSSLGKASEGTPRTQEAEFIVLGSVSDESGVGLVAVNATPVFVAPDGTFAITLTLTPGTNPITVTATDLVSNTAYLQREVIYSDLDHFDVAVPPIVTAGEAFSVTVTARGTDGTVYPFTGTVDLDDADQTLKLVGPWSMTNGTGKANVRLSKARTDAVIAALGEGRYGESVPFTVEPGPLAYAAVSPLNVRLYPNLQQQYTAKAYDTYDNEIANPSVVWSLPEYGGSVEQDGMVTAGTFPGTFAVQADVTVDGVTKAAQGSVTTRYRSESDLKTSSIEASGRTFSEGDLVTYTVIIRNTGEEALNATFVNAIPNLTTYAAGSLQGEGAAYNEIDDAIEWANAVAAGTTQTVTYQVYINNGVARGTSITSTLKLGEGSIVTIERWAIIVIGVPDVSASQKLVSHKTVRQSQVITYTLVACNTGAANATNAYVFDPLPENMSYVLNSITNGASYNAVENRVEWSGALVRGESITVSYQVRINDTVPNNTLIVNTASFFYGLDDDMGVSKAVTSTLLPNLSIDENRVWTDPSTVRQGQNVILGANVINNSGAVIESVVVQFYHGDPDGDPGGTLVSEEAIPFLSPYREASIQTGVPLQVPVNMTGTLDIYVKVDPRDGYAESNEQDNIATRSLPIMPEPPSGDITPPPVGIVSIENGAYWTENGEVSLALTAMDNPNGTGIGGMYIVEYGFNYTARKWTPVNASGWVDYNTEYAWTLQPVGGVHYIQAWFADNAGNIIQVPGLALINYRISTETLQEGESHLYRYWLAEGLSIRAMVNTVAGDPDLYVWNPGTGGPPTYWSNAGGKGEDEQVMIPATEKAGYYQFQVYAFDDTQYALQVSRSSMRQGIKSQSIAQAISERPLPSEPLTLDTPPGKFTGAPFIPKAAEVDLGIGKVDDPDPVEVGHPLTYTITITNNGPDMATGVMLTDTLPLSVTFGLVTSSQADCDERGTLQMNRFACDLGELGSTEVATVTIVVTPTIEGTLHNTAKVIANELDTSDSNNIVIEETVVNAGMEPALKVSKVDSSDPVVVGRLLTYTIAVTNAGTISVTGVTLTDTLPLSVTFDSIAFSQGSCEVNVCDLGTLDTMDVATITLAVTTTAEGWITNSVRVTANELGNFSIAIEDTTVIRDEEQTQVYLPLVLRDFGQ
jgi:uncharacterized repeat protein (TIGR01451 family)